MLTLIGGNVSPYVCVNNIRRAALFPTSTCIHSNPPRGPSKRKIGACGEVTTSDPYVTDHVPIMVQHRNTSICGPRPVGVAVGVVCLAA